MKCDSLQIDKIDSDCKILISMYETNGWDSSYLDSKCFKFHG